GGTGWFGEHEPFGSDNRPRPAVVEAHAREPDVIEPLRSRREVVLLLEQLQRQVVEGPHALVAGADRAAPGGEDECGDERKAQMAGHGAMIALCAPALA